MILLKKLKLLYVFLFYLNAMGQSAHMPFTNAYINAGAYSTHFLDAFSFLSNPACLGSVKGFSSGILTERKWMLKELDSYALAATTMVGGSGLGISLQRSGDASYKEQAMELAYGKNLGRLEIGIRFNYLRDQAAAYPGLGFGSCGTGMRFPISSR